MTTIHRDRNYIIKVLQEDNHELPHCHIIGPDFSASVGIRKVELLGSKGNSRSLDHALEWVKAHREILLSEWERLNSREEEG